MVQQIIYLLSKKQYMMKLGNNVILDKRLDYHDLNRRISPNFHSDLKFKVHGMLITNNFLISKNIPDNILHKYRQ